MNKYEEYIRKIKEYEMKLTKMSGYLSDYYIDRAIETEDFSNISSLLIDYFTSGYMSPHFDIGNLITKYKEFGLNEKIEDIDFNINEWYKLKYELENIKETDPEFKKKYEIIQKTKNDKL